MSDIHTIWRFESPTARVCLGSRPCENSNTRAAVYEFQVGFRHFRPLQARQCEKIRSRCAVFRQFPSFHTVWVDNSRGDCTRPMTAIGAKQWRIEPTPYVC